MNFFFSKRRRPRQSVDSKATKGFKFLRRIWNSKVVPYVDIPTSHLVVVDHNSELAGLVSPARQMQTSCEVNYDTGVPSSGQIGMVSLDPPFPSVIGEGSASQSYGDLELFYNNTTSEALDISCDWVADTMGAPSFAGWTGGSRRTIHADGASASRCTSSHLPDIRVVTDLADGLGGSVDKSGITSTTNAPTVSASTRDSIVPNNSHSHDEVEFTVNSTSKKR
jgi:hypothetical protein